MSGSGRNPTAAASRAIYMVFPYFVDGWATSQAATHPRIRNHGERQALHVFVVVLCQAERLRNVQKEVKVGKARETITRNERNA